MNNSLTVRERVERLANEKGTTISAVERDLGLGTGTIAKWNKSTPSKDKARKVAAYFGVSEAYLYGEEELPENETDRLAETLLHNDQLRALMDRATHCTPEEVRVLMEVMKTWEK